VLKLKLRIKMKKNQKGFTVIEILFFVLLAAILIGMAYYVGTKSQNNKTQKTASSSAKTSPPAVTADKTDKEQIRDLIATACSGNTQAAQTTVDKSQNLTIDGTWASIGVSCDEEGGGYRAYLKKTDSKWDFFLKTQDTPSCTKFDGSGVSLKILPECYDDTTTHMRAPK
jgi:competence protein ComGC